MAGSRGLIDRDEVLARIDLGELADRLVGPRKMVGSSSKWPSPVQGHEQTGRTPPMSIFTDRRGFERWTCFATGHRGTAFDLVMETRGCDFKEAVSYLAGMVGVEPGPVPEPLRRSARTRKAPLELTEAQTVAGLEALRRWHGECEGWLDSHSGRLGREWLAARGYGSDDIASARVGFDPGPQRVPRPEGLPRVRPALVLPVMDCDGEVIFAQSRTLNPRSAGKYFNPVSRLEGRAEVAVANPGIGWLQPAVQPLQEWPIVLCEGITDAIAARPAGFECACIIGTGNAVRESVLAAVAARAGTRPVVVCFDGDAAGLVVAAQVASTLRASGAAAAAMAFEGMDLSEAAADLGGERFREVLRREVLEHAQVAMRQFSTDAQRVAAAPDASGPAPAESRVMMLDGF